MNKFYITTAIPYVNGNPHIGHALEYFQADTIRNYHRLKGDRTLLLSGADENALKNVQKAEEEGIPTQEFLDRNSEVFKKSYERLGVKLDVFERGSDSIHHFPGVQKLWELCEKNGDIYKKSYTGLYCVGCESFKTEKELVDGKCPIHQTVPDNITEENYFFKLSRYQENLLDLIDSGKLQIFPNFRRNETMSFIKQGLEDFSISRSKQRAKGVGVPVPNDPSQVMYVWFDALAIYITGIGYGVDEKNFNKWWPCDLHVIGKDINRFHTIYWPAMLLSAGLPTPKAVLVHGFVQTGGVKMSKSLGNVIDPFEISEKYGLEAFRYFMLSQIPTTDDGDFTIERFIEVYNADLANGLGNLVARVAKLAKNDNFQTTNQKAPDWWEDGLENYRLNEVLEKIWQEIKDANLFIDKNEPWKILDKEKLRGVLTESIQRIFNIANELEPFLPQTSAKIKSQFEGKTKEEKALFPRT